MSTEKLSAPSFSIASAANPATKDRLITDHLELVDKIANSFRLHLGNTRVTLDELVAAGREGLCEAAERFDATVGAQFSTFAYWRIKGAMVDAIRLTEAYSRTDVANYRAAQARPSEHVTQRRRSRAVTIVSYDHVRSGVGSQDLGGTAEVSEAAWREANDLPSASVDPETLLAERENEAARRRAIEALPRALATLGAADRELLNGLYVEGKRCLEISAERGVHHSRVSRRHQIALNRLRAAMLELGVDVSEG